MLSRLIGWLLPWKLAPFFHLRYDGFRNRNRSLCSPRFVDPIDIDAGGYEQREVKYPYDELRLA